MEYQKYYLVLFNSKSYAIATEKALQKYNIPVEAVNAPIKLAKSCTLALKFDASSYQQVLKYLKKTKYYVYKLYMVSKENNQEIVREIYF